MDAIKARRAQFIAVHNAFEGVYHAYAQKAGMTEIPFRILCAVCDGQAPLSQVDVCRLWNFPKQSVNTAINRLVKQGYVQLVQDKEASGNRKLITLTKEGKAYCKKWVDPLLAADLKAFGLLSESEQVLYIDVIRRQRDSLRASLETVVEKNLGRGHS